MPVDFFHAIADPDSAEVRRYLVAHELTAAVNFRNIAYESHAEALRAATGSLTIPCVITDEKVAVLGKSAILEWLKIHLSRPS
jgi:hypothetical protein